MHMFHLSLATESWLAMFSHNGASQAMLKVRKLAENSRMPCRATQGSAGYDLYAAEDTKISAGERACISTGISIVVPDGHYGRIASRSGLAAKSSIDVGAGVIDADYRGEIKILLCNSGKADFVVKTGDRVAQLILERISVPAVEEVHCMLDTLRGGGAFGSTGV